MGIRKNPFPRRFLPFKDPDFCAKPSMVVTISRGKHPPWMGETRHMHDTPTSKFLETKHQRKGEMRMAGSGYSDWMYKNPRGSYWKFGSRIRSFWGILPKKTSIKGPLVFFFMWEILLRVSCLVSCLLHRGSHRRWGRGRKVEETNGMENPLGSPKAGDGGTLLMKGVTLDD